MILFDEAYALALEPALVRRAETLLDPISYILRHILLHHLPQQQLAVPGLMKICLLLATDLVLIQLDHMVNYRS